MERGEPQTSRGPGADKQCKQRHGGSNTTSKQCIHCCHGASVDNSRRTSFRPSGHDLTLIPAAAPAPQHIPNGQQPHPDQLPNAVVPLALRPAASSSQAGVLSLLHEGYLALYAVLDVDFLRRDAPDRCRVCLADALSQLERDMARPAGV